MTERKNREESLPRIVYFFLPTPEPMRFPEGFICETLRPLDLDVLRKADLSEMHEPPDPELMCSLKIWQIDRPFQDYFSAQYDAMSEAIRRGLPPDFAPPPHDEWEDEAGETSGFVQTVCEVAVLAEEWSEADESEEATDPLTDAFDLALEVIRSLQNAYYLATQEPVTLISQEALPPIVPCFVRRVVDGRPVEDDWGEGASAFFINDGFLTLVPGEPLDEEELGRFQEVLDTAEPGRVFLGFADMLRDARAALRRGEYRTAVVSAESAAQVLLDDLLLHMLWEEGVDPEEAANYFRDVGLSKRIRTHFHERLAGNWSMKQGAIGQWQKKLSAVRHRVVHAGYQPTRLEAYDALDAVKELNDFVAMRLSANKSVRQYPRTALALLGIEELDRRGRMARWLRDLMKEPNEPHWTNLFVRWRWVVHDHLNEDERPYPGEDHEDRYQYVLLAQPDGTTSWWVHDRARRRVCLTAEPADLTDKARESFAAGIAALVEKGIDEAHTMAWLGAPAATPDGDVEWLREHVVFPQYAIMLPERR